MSVYPYKKDGPIIYEFTTCPIAEFAKENNLLEALSAMCNADFAAMECIHAKIVRKAPVEMAVSVIMQYMEIKMHVLLSIST